MSEFITRSISSKGERGHLEPYKTANWVTFSMSTEKLKNLLNPCGNGELADMVQRAQSMGALSEALIEALPGDFATSIVAANIRDNRHLVVVAATSAWAARLRFEAALLQEAARKFGASVDSVSVRVAKVDRS